MEKIKIYDRRGAVDDRPKEKQMLDPWDESERAYAKHFAEQDKRRRYWEGQDEFEPALFNVLDDAEDLREMATDPMLYFVTGVVMERDDLTALRRDCKSEHEVWIKARPCKDPAKAKDPVRLRFMEPLYSIGVIEPTDWNVWVKVVPLPHADWEHVAEFKMPRYGDLRVNLTHGEQEEVRRESGGSRLKEEELAMDFRSPSKFLLDETLFITVDFELPNVPQNVIEWLEETAWPGHDNTRDALKRRIRRIINWKVPNQDNRRREIKAIRRAFQAKMLNRMWGKFWSQWVRRCKEMEPTGHRPMTNRQLASIKALFEQCKRALNLEKPEIRFWARCHCFECDTQFNRLLPIVYQDTYVEGTNDRNGAFETNYKRLIVKCYTCENISGQVLWYEEHSVIEKREETDWFEVAQDLKEKIDALYKIAADVEEIKPLENRLAFIEHMYIKIPAEQLLWGEYDAIDERFC